MKNFLFFIALLPLPQASYSSKCFPTTPISECCSSTNKTDYLSLLDCVRTSASRNLEINTIVNVPKIGFVTYGTSHIVSYSALAFAINQAYASHNCYLFHIADPNTSNYESADVRWNKVRILEDALSTWAKDVEYLVWLDAGDELLQRN